MKEETLPAAESKQPAKRGPKPKAQTVAIDPAQYAADMSEIKSMFADMAGIMKGMQHAINNPVIIRKAAYDTDSPKQEQTLSAPNGEFKVLNEIGFEAASAVQNPGVDKHHADMAMLEDELTVFTPTVDDPKDTCFGVTNNGKLQIFVRGQEQKIKRKFVEMVLRLRQRIYETIDNPDRLAEEAKLQKMHTNARHRIEIIYDPNPRGKQWRAELNGQR